MDTCSNCAETICQCCDMCARPRAACTCDVRVVVPAVNRNTVALNFALISAAISLGHVAGQQYAMRIDVTRDYQEALTLLAAVDDGTCYGTRTSRARSLAVTFRDALISTRARALTRAYHSAYRHS